MYYKCDFIDNLQRSHYKLVNTKIFLYVRVYFGLHQLRLFDA
jgi:hypothetical protein